MKYKRSPRMQQKLPSEDIILAAPPASHRKYEKSRGVIASLFGSGAMFGASMLTGTMSPALLAARSAAQRHPAVMTKSERKVWSNTKRYVTKNTEHISMSRKPVLKQSHAFSVKF